MTPPERTLLDAEWQSGPKCLWKWEHPTRVSGLEIEGDPTGELVALDVGNESQLMTAGLAVSLVAIAEFWPQGALTESPAEGWKIGRIALPSQSSGVALLVVTRNFPGRLRPFGVQVKR